MLEVGEYDFEIRENDLRIRHCTDSVHLDIDAKDEWTIALQTLGALLFASILTSNSSLVSLPVGCKFL